MDEHAKELVPLLWSILIMLAVLIIGMVKMYIIDLRRWQEKQDAMHKELRKTLSGLSTRVAHIEGKLGILPGMPVEEQL
jgi:hypothetical protein